MNPMQSPNTGVGRNLQSLDEDLDLTWLALKVKEWKKPNMPYITEIDGKVVYLNDSNLISCNIGVYTKKEWNQARYILEESKLSKTGPVL